MAPSVARESTLHCKLDLQLQWAAARSMVWVGGKWIMEILVYESVMGNGAAPATPARTRVRTFEEGEA
jgi:hypothetical protein